MLNSNLSGAVFFRRLSIFGLTCWLVDGGSTSSGGQKSLLLQTSKDLAHVWRQGDLLPNSSAAVGPSHDPYFDPKCSVVGIFFFLRALCLGK